MLSDAGASRPLLRTVQYPQQFDPLGAGLDAVDRDERRFADNQFSRALLAARPTQFRVLDQPPDVLRDPVALLDGRLGVVLRDVVQLRIPVRDRSGEPYQPQAVLPARLSNSARCVAQLASASSFDIHTVFGSSASLSASVTSARNHLS